MPSSKPEATTARIASLDALRGIAALGVVFWHFQHFGGYPATYPYVNVWGVSWMYVHGWVLVDFFFLLSGVLFTFKYLDALAARTISARNFFVLRMSRIYPLHLATLLIVAAIQWRRLYRGEEPLLQGGCDAYHFVLNLLFLHSGFFEDGFSYNLPSWSVGAEAFVYVVFFLVATRYGKDYPLRAACLALLAMGIYKIHWAFPLLNDGTARSIFGFFAGSLLFLVIGRVHDARLQTAVGLAAAALFAVFCFMAGVTSYDRFFGSGFNVVSSHVMALFPLILVMALTLAPLAKVLSVRPLTYLGDISYALYMLHVPLQMAILSVFEAIERPVPSASPIFFWFYVPTLFSLAALVHHAFELPAQRWLRKRFLSNAGGTAEGGAAASREAPSPAAA